ASLTLSSLAVGAHSLTASYGGDTLDAPSQSSTTTQTISPVSAPAPTTTSLTSSENPAPSAAAVTLTATVTGPGATPTGKVAFLDGTATLGIASLDPSGRASLTLSSLTLGAHSLTAVYGGDAGHAGSTSAMLSETISAATSRTSLSVSPNPAWVGQAVTLTATVASTGQKPRGTVTFSDGGHTIGSARLHDGRAVLITTFREAGDRGIVAAYAGGGGIGASTSASVSLTVRQHPPCCHPGDPWNDPHCGPPARLSDDR
ncbi:MAG: Ig-like domain repeat protein, partial [Candidatus Dormibacteria bacterium]